MILLGMNAYHGDAAIAAVADGKLLFAAEEERFNRIKHSAGLPMNALKEILERADLSPRDIDYVTISRSPTAHLFPKLQHLFKNHPPLSFLKERIHVSLRSANISKKLERFLGPNGKWRAKEACVEHHLSHAASAFYPSGFDRSAILTVDGFGDFSSTMFGIGEGNKIKVLKRVLFPHSLGILYTAATQYLGFVRYGDEYKVMGLSAYGNPRFLKAFRELIHPAPDESFQLNLDYFTHPKGGVEMTWLEGEPRLGPLYSQKWHGLFGPARRPEDPLTDRDKDLAASLQAVFEETFFHLLRNLYGKTRIKNLCLAGGSAFNSAANGKIFDRNPFEKVYIQPAAGDAGTALGSALYTAHHRFNLPRSFVMDHAYCGPEFSEVEIEKALGAREDGIRIEKIPDQNTLCVQAAKAIADGKVVGWFQGRMEWGPRALGNRSLLADPRRPEMKDFLNHRIKHREGFRPFAPSVLEERSGDWFQMKCPASPFMNLVFPVRPEKREKIPAVTHGDGTARVHTVSKEVNPLFWKLIQEFEKISRVPMVLNTSFNDNEPMVASPEDALNCFLRTPMDLLVMGPYWIERRGGPDVR